MVHRGRTVKWLKGREHASCTGWAPQGCPFAATKVVERGIYRRPCCSFSSATSVANKFGSSRDLMADVIPDGQPKREAEAGIVAGHQGGPFGG